LHRSGPIYDPQRVAGVKLSPETQDLLNQAPQELEDKLQLNRRLLQDAYPQELARMRGFPKGLAGLGFLGGLFLAKLLATLATVGSGAVGGVFSPTLFLGAGLGTLFGLALKEAGALQQLGAGEGLIATFGVVGMGSMLAATTRSPLLAMIMVFEISLSYSLMPPLMLGCVVSIVVASRLHPESIYTETLRLRGLELSHETLQPGAAAEQRVGDLM